MCMLYAGEIYYRMKIFVDKRIECLYSMTHTAIVLRLRRIIMAHLSLQVEVLAGTSIRRAALEARELARKLDLAYVKFSFNGVDVSIGQHANEDAVGDKVAKAIGNENMHEKYVIENGE